MLEILLLGPLEMREDGQTLPVRRQKLRALAAALALRPGKPVSPERLVDDLWGENPPRMARDALQNYVSQLRQVLGRDRISTTPAGYMLEIEPQQTDVFRFASLVGDRSGDAAERESRLREALSLLRGPPLADLALEPFAGAEIGRLEELELSARESLLDAELELGRHADVVSELETLIARSPYRERFRAQLMIALYRCGRQADALEAYRDARRVLSDDLGIEPGEELQRLEGAVLRHDDTLRAPTTQRPRSAADVATEAPRRPRAARKTVTVLFSTLAGAPPPPSPDPEVAHLVYERQAAAVRAAVEQHGGVHEPVAGDELLAVFGVPAAHEDDALRAVRAAVDVRNAIETLDPALQPRIGVGTGEVYVTESHGTHGLVAGAAIAVAERLEQVAGPGEIVIGPDTHRLVGDAVVAEAVDLDERRSAYRVVGLVPDNFSRRLRLEAPMIGRARQLTALQGAYDAAVEDGTRHLFTLLGAPGVGKSRLAGEFTRRLDGAFVLLARCPSYGEGTTFRPLLELVPQAAVISDAVAAHADAVASAEATGSLQEVTAESLTLFDQVARLRPLVLVLEDLQWAEDPFLDLVERLVDDVRGGPILVLCVARPELLEARRGWAGGKPNASTLLLEPLTDEESEQLLDALLGDSDLPQLVRDHITRGADGNPLFVEELLAMLVERNVLRREEGRWTTRELAVPRIPPSIRALIQARVDRLPDDERGMLEVASVEGAEFHRDAVADLLADDAADAGVLLAALARKELVRPAPREGAMRFRHRLIRDAVYESVPKRRRAELHAGVADWLERQGSAPDLDEVVAHHLELACRYRREVGDDDDRTQALAVRAAKRLTAASTHAAERGDATTAGKLLARAEALSAN